MAILQVNGPSDFRNQSLTNITEIHFADSVKPFDQIQAIFSSAQFGPGLIASTVLITHSESPALISVEFIAGTTDLDARGWTLSDRHISASFTGTDEDETLFGSRTNDSINLLAGFDTVYAGRGDDEIFSSGDGRADVIDGGRDHDSLWIYRTDIDDLNIDISNGGKGLDIGDGTTIENIEELIAYAGYGNDIVIGGSAKDYISGGGGNDIIDGGRQVGVRADKWNHDELIGGGGEDHFVFAALSDSGPARLACDLIRDFNNSSRSQPDKIDISAILEDLDVSLTLSDSTTFTGVAGELVVMVTKRLTKTFLNLDADGDRDSDFCIALRGNLSITIDDFILT